MGALLKLKNNNNTTQQAQQLRQQETSKMPVTASLFVGQMYE